MDPRRQPRAPLTPPVPRSGSLHQRGFCGIARPAGSAGTTGGDEIIQIVDGEAELTFPNGTVTTVKPGDIVYFPGAQIVRFNVPHDIRKVSLYSDRTSLTRRLVQKVPFARRIVHKVRARRSMFIA